MFTYILNKQSVIVLDTSTGEQIKFFENDDRYQTAIDLIKEKKFEEIFKLDLKTVIKSFFEESNEHGDIAVRIVDGVGKVIMRAFNNLEVDLHPAITSRIIKMNEQGFPPASLLNFIGNLYCNPNKTAIDELYLFIEACDLPITEDGHFIAYKIVKSDYFDIYSGTMSNKIGEQPSMPRHLVDTDRNRTCSAGLHFCSKNYLNHYGSASRNDDRCMLVKIHPADVVSIPSDYNNAKGRAWTYSVVGEMEAGWRNTLPQSDYTEDCVVSDAGEEIADQEYIDESLESLEDVFADSNVYFMWVDDADVFIVLKTGEYEDNHGTWGEVVSVLTGDYYEVGYADYWDFDLVRFTPLTEEEYITTITKVTDKCKTGYFYNETTKRYHRKSDGKMVKASEASI